MSDDEGSADGTSNGGQPGGSELGEEARRLAEAVQHWAQRTMPAPPSGHPGPECQWCPLCQFASVLRGEHPELLERAAEAGTALVNAFRMLADSAAQHTAGTASGHHSGHAPDGAGGHPETRPGEAQGSAEQSADAGASSAQSPRVQRIRLTDPADAPGDLPPTQ